MILTLGFQTILPAQIALMSARGVNTPLGWYIVIAQMAGVLLAFMGRHHVIEEKSRHAQCDNAVEERHIPAPGPAPLFAQQRT